MSLISPILKLLIVPIIFIVIEYSFIKEIFPLYAGRTFDADPAYQYLLNGLMLLNAQAPAHTDHPGTTVQVLIATVILAKWLLGLSKAAISYDDIFYSVLSEPEASLLTVSLVLILLNAYALFYLGKRIYHSTQNFALPILSQFAPFLFAIACPSIAYPSTESLLFFSTTLLLGLLAPIIFKIKGAESITVSPIAVGLICGFGLATKLNFAPLLILILLMRFRASLVASITAGIAFLCFIAPAWSKIGQLYKWGLSLMTHEGNYGIGPQVGFFTISGLTSKIKMLFLVFPFLYALIFLIIFFSLVALSKMKFIQAFFTKRDLNKLSERCGKVNRAIESRAVWLFFVIILTICLQILMVTKHFHIRYMLPIFPLIVVGVLAMLPHLSVVLTTKASMAKLLTITTLVLVSTGMVITRDSYQEAKQNNINQAQTLAVVQAEIAKFSNPIVIGTYGCMLPTCALSYGVSASAGLTEKLKDLFRDHYDLNIWNGLLRSNYNGWMPVSFVVQAVSEGRTVLLVVPTQYPDLEGFALDSLIKMPTQALYRVKGLAVPANKSITFNSAALRFDNWSFAETNFRWSLGMQSSISFHLNSDTTLLNESPNVRLRLQFTTLGSQSLSVYLNDQQILSEQVEGSGIVKDIVLSSNALKSGENVLTFKTPDAKSPSAADDRVLAIAFQSLVLASK